MLTLPLNTQRYRKETAFSFLELGHELVAELEKKKKQVEDESGSESSFERFDTARSPRNGGFMR